MKRISTLLVTSLLLANTAWAGNPETLMAVGMPAQTASTVNTLYGTGLTASMTPATDNAIDLGSASKQFRSEYLGTNLIFGAASAKIIPGSTSLLIRNNADSASNFNLLDGGGLRLAQTGAANAGLYLGLTTKVSDIPDSGLIDISDVGTTIQATFQQSTADVNGVIFDYNKTRKTDNTADTIVASGDTIVKMRFRGADGASFREAAQIVATVDGTPGSSDMPGALDFQTTPDGSATPASVLKLDNAKGATFTGKIIANAGVLNVATNVEAVAGAGTTVADAAALSATKFFHQITGANGTVGWKFPTLVVGDVHYLLGTTAGVAKVYAVSGGTCNGQSADTACTLTTGIMPHICYATATNAIICS